MELTPSRPLPAPYASLRPTSAWSDARGALFFFEPEPHVIYSIARGFVTAALARGLRTGADPVFERVPRVWGIHDWAEVTGYESAARTILTDWALQRRAKFVGCTILTSNRLVAMGASAMSVPMAFAGITLEAFTDRRTFETRSVKPLSAPP